MQRPCTPFIVGRSKSNLIVHSHHSHKPQEVYFVERKGTETAHEDLYVYYPYSYKLQKHFLCIKK